MPDVRTLELVKVRPEGRKAMSIGMKLVPGHLPGSDQTIQMMRRKTPGPWGVEAVAKGVRLQV